jgi:hypothetical protein
MVHAGIALPIRNEQWCSHRDLVALQRVAVFD